MAIAEEYPLRRGCDIEALVSFLQLLDEWDREASVQRVLSASFRFDSSVRRGEIVSAWLFGVYKRF
jgi:hypothetical protein